MRRTASLNFSSISSPEARRRHRRVDGHRYRTVPLVHGAFAQASARSKKSVLNSATGGWTYRGLRIPVEGIGERHYAADARYLRIVDTDHLAGNGAGFVAQEIDDDLGDPPGGARLVDVDRHSVDRDVALEEIE
jgi:hypothetical protein